jgi:hypothetical protein
MTPESLQELQRILLTKQPRGAVGSTTPDVGSITPLSPYEALQAERSQLSSDPVIANLQKFGRGVKGLFEPETPLDYLSMAAPPLKTISKPLKTISKPLKTIPKAKKIQKGVYQYRGHIIEDMGGYWNWGVLPKKAKHWTEAQYEDASNNLKDAKNSIDSIIEKSGKNYYKN